MIQKFTFVMHSRKAVIFSIFLFFAFNLIAQPEVFKYRLYLGNDRCIYRYNNTGAVRTYEYYGYGTGADAQNNPILAKGQKLIIFPQKDTLYLNFWLKGKDTRGPAALNNWCGTLEANAHDYSQPYTYYIHVPNRQTLRFTYLNFEVSALTAPIKFRFADSYYASYTPAGSTTVKDTTVKVYSAALAQVNLNLNLALRFGQVRYTGEKYGGMQTKNIVSGVVGGFVGFSALSLDNTNTTSKLANGDTTVFPTRTVPSFSIGASLGLNVRNIDFLVLVGYEIPMAGGVPWDYRRKPFIGFGIGYGSTIFK